MTEPNPPQHSTIIDALESRSTDAELRVERGVHGEERSLSVDEIIGRSRDVGAGLREAGVQPGDVCALLLPTSPEFVFSCFGTWYAGGVPTVLPLSLPKNEATVERVRAILDSTEPTVLITTDFVWSQVADEVELSELTTVADVKKLLERDGSFDPSPPEPNREAFIQFTSGSTGTPKGVVVRHDQLAANIRATCKRGGYRKDDRLVSWIPMFHDLGLVAGFLSGFYWDLSMTLIPTERFVQDPDCWLDTMEERNGTVCQAPTFAYELVAAKMHSRADALNLSHVRSMWIGAEPVFEKSVQRFQQTFGSSGLGSRVLKPCYGLAEATLGVTGTRPDKPPSFDRIDRRALRAERRAQPCDPEADVSMAVTSLGPPLDGMDIEIRDGTEPLEERSIGEVCLRSEYVVERYLDRPVPRDEDGWFHTGDLGYLADGELHLTGRQKDLIVRGGRNIHPSRLEQAAGEVDSVRTGRVVAFGDVDFADQSDRTVVVVEPESDAPSESEIRKNVRRQTQSATGVQVDEVFVAERGFVPKTTSGKLRRGKCREMYRESTE